MTAHPPGLLDGVRVVDLTSIVMGPLATQILGDLGADVITVEDPRGTLSRVMTAGPHPGLSGVALNLLRNKRNVVLDLKTEAGRDALLEVTATADVLVTNLRPGTLARLRLTFEDIVMVRPDIVYCQAQGYPSDSESADAPAYDDVIQAATGLPDAFRRFGGEPLFAPTLIADKVSGLTIAYAVLAALFHRERTGEGQRIEVPMVDVMTAFMLVEHAGAATARPPQGPPGYQRILNPERRPQRTRDGWISVLPYTRQNFEDIFRSGDRDDLADDERIRTARGRIDHADDLYREVAGILTRRTTAEWLEFCQASDVPASPVPTLDQLVDGLDDDRHPVAGPYKVIPQPVRFSRMPGPTVRRPAALSGQHTDEVLAEVRATGPGPERGPTGQSAGPSDGSDSPDRREHDGQHRPDRADGQP
jgi:crotonobetainyl-CoA:carnitine CoA-transferase CaiB-like acyl-CoA transferase